MTTSRPEITIATSAGALRAAMTRPMPETIDPFENLSPYTTDQLQVMNDYLEPELIRLCNEQGATMTEAETRKWFEALTFLNRVGAELLRRRELPSAGPRGICYIDDQDGRGPVRLSFTILAF
jgi:hypothetical protein